MKQLTKSLLIFLLITIVLTSTADISVASIADDPIGYSCVSSPYMSMAEYK